MSILDTWLAWMVLAIAVAFALGYYLPRFSAYFLGPAFLALGGLFFIEFHRLFFPFRSDGSIAGLLVPALLWLALATCCLLGCVLIATGVKRARRKSPASAEANAGQSRIKG